MHKNALKDVAGQLKAIAERMEHPDGLPNGGTPILAGSERAESFQLGDDAYGDLLKLVKALHGHYGSKYSEEHIHRELDDVLRRVLEVHSADIIQAEIERIDQDFEAFNESHFIVVPLAGVELAINELQLGNVKLVRLQGDAAEALRARCRSVLTRNTAHTEAQKEQIFKEIEGGELSKVLGRTCATITVSGENHRAVEVALDETRRAVDLLRYLTLFIPGRRKYSLGIQGEIGDGKRTTVAIRTDEESVHYLGVANYDVLAIGQWHVELMKNLGILDLSDLLQKPQRTNFEQALIRAVHWLASGQAQFENENALLNFITCIEALLKPSAQEPITAAIAEGTAILIRKTLDERKEVKKQVKDFYQKRCTLTHEGEGQILDADLRGLKKLALELTVHLVGRRGEFTSQQQLRSWLEDKKLSG
jgi:hypothetical protein